MNQQPALVTAPPFIILADTREQSVPPFPAGVEVQRATLAEGDYSTPSLVNVARIERKSLGDLVGSLTHDRERFMREIERLKAYAFRLLVVEADMAHVVEQRYRSARVLPQAIVGSVCSLIARHACPVLFAHDATTAGYVIAGILRRLKDEQAKGASPAPEAA